MPFIALKVHSGSVIKIVQRLQPSVWHNSLLQMYSFLPGGFGPLVALWLAVKCRDLWLHGSMTCFIFTEHVVNMLCCGTIRFAPGPTQCSCSCCFWMCLDAAASFLQTTGLQVNPCSINKRATCSKYVHCLQLWEQILHNAGSFWRDVYYKCLPTTGLHWSIRSLSFYQLNLCKINLLLILH